MRRGRRRRGCGREAAARIGLGAVAARVDVREAESVRDLVDRTVGESWAAWTSGSTARASIRSRRCSSSRTTTGTDVLDANLRGTLIGAREAARTMIAAGRGRRDRERLLHRRVPRRDAPGAAHYVASKFGVRGLTQSLAVELGRTAIRVLAVAPTVTLTPGLEGQRERARVGGLRARRARPAAAARPGRRPGRCRPCRRLLRVRPLAADDREHPARRRRRARLSISPGSRGSTRGRLRNLGPRSPSMSSSVTSGSSPSRLQVAGIPRQ